MFKDMNTDPMLMTAGISSEWPHGRCVKGGGAAWGVYVLGSTC